MIPQRFIDDLLSRVDIVDVVGQYVKLKKAGANFQGLCPFHREKTPSFTVSAPKQFFHCFGCGKNGTAIGFLTEHLGISFPDAVEELAQRVGMIVPHEQQARTPEAIEQQKQARAHNQILTDLLAQAADFYRSKLRGAPRAVDYLKQRGLNGEIAARYGLGYAPDAWQSLQNCFSQYDDPILEETGLVIAPEAHESDAPANPAAAPRSRKRYDRFRDRIMFPICNLRGETIGFGGRIMGAGEPKYLNSPETPVFSKGRELYGAWEGREAIRDAHQVVVVEGYMDVIALAQAGVGNAVATLGTATTPDHIKVLFRLADQVVFAFDGDAAGRKAARRALEACLPMLNDQQRVEFLFLPPNDDPDSLVRREGLSGWQQQLAQALPLSRFMVQTLVQEAGGIEVAEGRARVAAMAKPWTSAMPHCELRKQLEREIYFLTQPPRPWAGRPNTGRQDAQGRPGERGRWSRRDDANGPSYSRFPSVLTTQRQAPSSLVDKLGCCLVFDPSAIALLDERVLPLLTPPWSHWVKWLRQQASGATRRQIARAAEQSGGTIAQLWRDYGDRPFAALEPEATTPPSDPSAEPADDNRRAAIEQGRALVRSELQAAQHKLLVQALKRQLREAQDPQSLRELQAELTQLQAQDLDV